MLHRIAAIIRALSLSAILTNLIGSIPSANAEGLVRLNLGGSWQVVREGTEDVIPATVPGCIHTDLLAAKKIPDPFYRDNEKSVQWIGEANWIYRRAFDVSPELRAREHVLLRCEGLDTLATIRVNGQEAGKTDNMFRTWEFDVKRLLKPGKNEIEIRFASVLPFIREKEKERHLPTWNYPGSSYVRKEPCNFGWDWGPTLITCGIWRDIGLVAFDVARIEDVDISQDHSQKGKVALNISITATASAALALNVQITVQDPNAQRANRRSGWQSVQWGSLLDLESSNVTIDNPKLWWPAGMGKQPLYTVSVSLRDEKGRELDSAVKRIGLRTLRAVEQTKDSPMHFEVNGVPFFAKGANWIPADSFANRVTKEKLRQYVADAAECNMNMLRLWGGGYYEDDALFDACDERGICLWCDLKFGCATYPAFDPAFLDNVTHEVDDNLRRLRHHPSIALWCGNNEIMFFRGGDKWTADKMSSSDYYKLFRDTLGGQVRRLAPQTDYVTGSPDCGDVHFWEVWHGGKPFEAYRQIHGFMSEFGFQSFPEPRTVAAFTAAGDRRSVYSPAMKHHERSNRGYLDVPEDGTIGTNKIMLGVQKYFREPKDFESTLWLSQITQAYGIQYAAEGWRREMPRSMGCVFWQYNDCWPCSSWSSVDYFGRWKALQYAAKRFYAPVLVSGEADAKKGTVDVYVTSDRLWREDHSYPLTHHREALLTCTVTTVSGEKLGQVLVEIDIPVPKSFRATTVHLQEYLKTHQARDLLVWLDLCMDGKTVSDNLVTLVYPRELDLLDPQVKTEMSAQGGDFKVKLSAVHPALWTWLTFHCMQARCSQNFVHVRPGAPVEIIVHPADPAFRDAYMKVLHVQSLYDTYAH